MLCALGLSCESCSELLSTYFYHSHSQSVPVSRCVVCVCACVRACKGKRGATLNANGAEQEELKGREAGGRLTASVSI